MLQHRLSRNMHITLQSREYVIEKRLPDKTIRLRDVLTDQRTAMPEQELIEALFQKGAELLGHDRNQDALKERLAKTGVCDSGAFSRSEKLENLAKLTGSTLDDLLSLLYLPAKSQIPHEDNHEFDFFGALLNRSIIRPHCPKVCPKCLAESAYSLRTWDCSLVTACPIHECELLDTCPDCKRRIKCVRNKLCVCSCGCDWREINSTVLPEEQLTVSRRIYQDQ